MRCIYASVYLFKASDAICQLLHLLFQDFIFGRVVPCPVYKFVRRPSITKTKTLLGQECGLIPLGRVELDKAIRVEHSRAGSVVVAVFMGCWVVMLVERRRCKSDGIR